MPESLAGWGASVVEVFPKVADCALVRRLIPVIEMRPPVGAVVDVGDLVGQEVVEDLGDLELALVD